MATVQEIEAAIALFDEARPGNAFKIMDMTNMGIGAVIVFLHRTNGTVTAGQISQFMQVSTARVAALLKKMTEKGLIVKETGTDDARTTLVRLSELGLQTVEKMRQKLYDQVGKLIDTLGMEKLLTFVSLSKEICGILQL